jgi:hypothetical protein
MSHRLIHKPSLFLPPRRGILSRRMFLKQAGLGAGAAMALPWLKHRAQAQEMIPRRFVIVLEGNAIEPINFLADSARSAIESAPGGGTVEGRWFPKSYPDEVLSVLETGNFESGPALGALKGEAGEVSLVDKSAVVFGLSSLVTGGGHSAHHGALGCSRSSPASPGGITIDSYLSKLDSVRQGSPFEALRVGVGNPSEDLNYQTCAFGPGRPAAIMLNPVRVYETLFGSVAGGAAQQSFENRSDLLEFAIADAEANLLRLDSIFSLHSRERMKMTSYVDSLHNLRQRQTLLSDAAGGWPARLSMYRPDDPTPTGPGTPEGQTDALIPLETQFDMVSAALKSGLTNMAVIASGTGNGHFNVTYRSVNDSVAGLESDLDRHNMHHGSTDSPAEQSGIREVTRRHTNLVARLARDLESVPEGNGTMLDHTVIVFMSDNGESHHSSAADWPMLLIGGGALGLQTGGRTVVYPNSDSAGHRQVSNFFNTLGYCAGVQLNDFGREGAKRIAEGPLPELLPST